MTELERALTTAQHALPARPGMHPRRTWEAEKRLRAGLLAAIAAGDVESARRVLAAADKAGIGRLVVSGANQPTYFRTQKRKPADERDLIVVAAAMPSRADESDAAMATILAAMIRVHRFGLRAKSSVGLPTQSRKRKRAEESDAEPIDPPAGKKRRRGDQPTFALNAALAGGNWLAAIVLLAHGAWGEPMAEADVDPQIWRMLTALGFDKKLSTPRRDNTHEPLLGQPAQWLIRLDRECGTALSRRVARFLYWRQPKWLHTGPIESAAEWYAALAGCRRPGWKKPYPRGAVELATKHRVWSAAGTVAWPMGARRWMRTIFMVVDRLARGERAALPVLPVELWHAILWWCPPSSF